MTAPLKRNLEIDRLRFIAASVVVAFHLLFFYFPIHMDNYAGYAITMVDLFFVISGYCISCSLVEQTDRLKENNTLLVAHLKSFFMKRILRIYPPLWVVFSLILLFSIFTNNVSIFSTPENNMQSATMLLTSTYNFFFTTKYAVLALTPFWSYSIEEQFYIAFPLFLLLTNNNRQRVKILIGVILAITFVIRPLTFKHYGAASIFFTQSHCDAIIYGFLIYVITRQSWFDALKPKAEGNFWLRMSFSILLFYIIIGITTLGYSPVIYLPISFLFASALMLVATFERNIIIFPAMIVKALDILSPRSLAVYVVHLPVILLVNKLYDDSGAPSSFIIMQKILLAILFILVVSELLYRLVVLPSVNTGKKLADDINRNANDKEGDTCALSGGKA